MFLLQNDPTSKHISKQNTKLIFCGETEFEGTNVCIFFDTQLMKDILNFYRTAFIKGLEKSKYSKTFLTDFRPVNLSSHEHLRKRSRWKVESCLSSNVTIARNSKSELLFLMFFPLNSQMILINDKRWGKTSKKTLAESYEHSMSFKKYEKLTKLSEFLYCVSLSWHDVHGEDDGSRCARSCFIKSTQCKHPVLKENWHFQTKNYTWLRGTRTRMVSTKCKKHAEHT